MVLVILCKVGVGCVGGFSCREFADIFESFLFVGGVLVRISFNPYFPSNLILDLEWVTRTYGPDFMKVFYGL